MNITDTVLFLYCRLTGVSMLCENKQLFIFVDGFTVGSYAGMQNNISSVCIDNIHGGHNAL